MSESMMSREARVHAGGGEYVGPTNTNGFSVINVSASGQDAIDRAVKLLSGIEGGIEKALRSTARKATARLRKANVQAVRERYAISAGNIRKEENVRVSYSYDHGVQATVRFGGERIPLFRFDGASPMQPTPNTNARLPVMAGEDHWRLMYPGVPASGHVLKGTLPYQFRSAFVARMPTGHVGIFERTGGMTYSSKDELEELFGPSVPQMLGNEEVARRLTEDAMEPFEKDLNHEILAILNGYMR